jgi:hypothetical protein
MFILYFFSMVGPACPAIALAAAEGIPKVLSVFPERSDLKGAAKIAHKIPKVGTWRIRNN